MKGVLTVVFLFYLASTCSSIRVMIATTNFNVLNYGAIGDGKTDDSQAFLKAWEDLCEATGDAATLLIPATSVFLLTPITFKGPCKSTNLLIQIQGTIVAPDNLKAWANNKETWLQFSDVNGLRIDGTGTIDGRGSIWWDLCKKDQDCERPTALRFSQCNGLQVTGTRHLNSGRNHISINGCEDVELSSLQIEAPSTSPNTDGVDISSSKNIRILNSLMATGDDCVAINAQSSFINITGVQCGPGHGISIGSLGKGGAYETVEEVHVRNCSFHYSDNGARIKTWQAWSGYVRKISFEDIRIENSKNPIIITQSYSNYYLGAAQNVAEISDITYRNVLGSSASDSAIIFDCNSCTNIVMDNVQLTSSTRGQVHATCSNVKGTQISVTPIVPCLSNPLEEFFSR